MVDYETYCRIRDHLVRQQLSVAQTARALALDARTVARWADVEQFRARKAVARASKLDAFKGQIVRWLDAHPYSAQQIYQRLAEAGYDGAITIVKDYVHRIRPRQQPVRISAHRGRHFSGHRRPRPRIRLSRSDQSTG